MRYWTIQSIANSWTLLSEVTLISPGCIHKSEINELQWFIRVEVVISLLYDGKILICPEKVLAKSVLVSIIMLIASTSFSSVVHAETRAASKPPPLVLGGFSLTPTVGGISYAGPDERSYNMLYGAKIGYDMVGKSIVESLGIEGTLNFFTVDSKAGGGQTNGYLFRLDAVYPFILANSRVVPFVALGTGGLVTSNEITSDASLLLNYGGGLKYFFEDYLALRADARHIVVYDANRVNTTNNFEFSVGLSYYFGKERKKAPLPPPDAKTKEQEQKEKETERKGAEGEGTERKGSEREGTETEGTGAGSKRPE